MIDYVSHNFFKPKLPETFISKIKKSPILKHKYHEIIGNVGIKHPMEAYQVYIYI